MTVKKKTKKQKQKQKQKPKKKKTRNHASSKARVGAGTTIICQKCQRPERRLQSEQLKAKKVLA